MLKFIEKNGLKLLQSELLLDIKGVNHAFSTKIGGISQGVYESLNIYSSQPEESINAKENRKILGDVLGFDSNSLVLAQQVHQANVHHVLKNDIGRGSQSPKDAISGTDSLITGEKDIPIMLLYADCLPILIADKNSKCVGVIHAGWKSTEKQILVETIKKMQSDFNINVKDLIIAIGIGISVKNFEIGQEVMDKLSRVSFSDKCFEERNNKIYADLIEINKSQALNFDVPEENIDYNKDLCTFENKDLFYSYRRDNKITGRHSAVIFKI
ncbi:MAG: peptidoglycan editing factor PgeF [Candidatus Sericytochromatia bacterium]